MRGLDSAGGTARIAPGQTGRRIRTRRSRRRGAPRRPRGEVCHGASGEGGRGPSLRGLAGRRVAGDPRFGYTPALRAVALTWNAATLDRFLASPQGMVPGTNMVLTTPDDGERQALIDYLLALPAAPAAASAGGAVPAAAVAPTPGLHVGRDAF